VQKEALRSALLDKLRQDLALQTSAAEMARDEAISEESRPENKWDTHSQEAAYLAEGQAKLAAEINASIELYRALPLPRFTAGDTIAIGALIDLAPANGGTGPRYFLGPRAGGVELHLDGRDVLVLTPQSPLGRQLLGRRLGDEIQAPGRGRTVTLRIAAIE
jgi:transcription elongation GreA/GreB family factor